MIIRVAPSASLSFVLQNMLPTNRYCWFLYLFSVQISDYVYDIKRALNKLHVVAWDVQSGIKANGDIACLKFYVRNCGDVVNACMQMIPNRGHLQIS